MPITQWYGAEIRAQIIAASIAAIDETTQQAAAEAEQEHWWSNQTDQLQEETLSEPARPVPGGAAGRFGSTQRRGFYGLMLEYKQPWLRPVADRVFPTVFARLLANYEGISRI